MHDILSSIGQVITGAFIAVMASIGFVPTPEPVVGVALPSAVAVFETSLASPITSSASSMTLTANSVRGGSTLSGYNCFTVDEGRTDAEFICGTVSGTAVSSLERGMDPVTGTSTNATLQFAHRRGAIVKITDFPIIQRLRNQANGVETFPNLLTYTNTVECGVGSATTTICPKAYTDQALVSGAPNADTATKGIVEIATAEEAKRSTALGSTGATLALPSSLATTTRNALTASGTIPVTGSTGYLPNDFINKTDNSWTFGSTTATSSFTVGSNASPASTTYNGLDYRMPTTRGASSTVLTENGSGGLRWYYPQSRILFQSVGSTTVASSATTSAQLVTIPAGTIATGTLIRISTLTCSVGGSDQRFEITYGNGSNTTTLAQYGGNNLGNPNGNKIMINMVNLANSTQKSSADLDFTNSGVGVLATPITRVIHNVSAVDTSLISYFDFRAGEAGSAATNGYCGITIEALKY